MYGGTHDGGHGGGHGGICGVICVCLSELGWLALGEAEAEAVEGEKKNEREFEEGTVVGGSSTENPKEPARGDIAWDARD